MANHPSAEKRNRQRIVATVRNRAVRSAVRTAVRKAHSALTGTEVAEATARVKEATKALVLAAKKGVLHDKTASRTISRIQSALAKLANG
jgi:small subunit ribosomal protein S20